MLYTKQKAFTLVELIVVVTILAILATIGFVSYSSYLIGVRDTNRIAQMTSLSDGLNLYSTTNDLPIPEDNVEVSVANTLIAYQGYAGANILETINFDKGGLDPKDNTYFSYYLTRDRKYFQMMGFLEESAELTSSNQTKLPPQVSTLADAGADPGIEGEFSFLNSAHAVNFQDRIPTVTGKKLGILTDDKNTPIQDLGENISITDSSTEEYIAYIDNDNVITGTGPELLQGVFSAVAGKGSKNCKSILDKNQDLLGADGEYWIRAGGETLKVYCDMTTEGGGWTLVIEGNDSDIIEYDSRGNDSWDSNDTISYGGTGKSFKFSNNLINDIRNKGMYMIHGNSTLSTEAKLYVASTCEYNHTLGLNGTCGGPNTIFNDVGLTSAKSCAGNVQYGGIGCWTPVIMNFTGSNKDNAFCYNNGGGWCAGGTENIVLKLFVR